MVIKAFHTSIFREGDSLIPFITKHIKHVPEKSVVVVTSKIVALSERRARVIEGPKTREKLIKAESQWAMRTKYVWLTIKDNMVLASAGIDESNADGKIILLPRDSFKSAYEIRAKLRRHYRVKDLGVVISDSRLLPMRAGVLGIAVGYGGFKGLKDYRGTMDIFGRRFKMSRTDIADSLATTAVLVMGEGAEQQPLALITKAPVEFTEHTNRNELAINIKEDIYQPVFAKIKRIRLKKK